MEDIGGRYTYKAPSAWAGYRRPAPRRQMKMVPWTGKEKKFFDTELTGASFATTWSTMENATTALSAVAQGTTESTHDGRQYTIHSIMIKGFIHGNAIEAQAAPVGDELARIVLVVDQQTNGVILTATDVMDGGAASDFTSFRNLQHTHRFRVLRDKRFRIVRGTNNEGAVDSFSGDPFEIPFELYYHFPKGLRVQTDNTPANISSITDTSIHLIGTASATIVLLSYTSRIRFTNN